MNNIAIIKDYLDSKNENKLIINQVSDQIGVFYSCLIDYLCSKSKIVIARELTKIYEEFYRGKISDLKKVIDETPEIEKGELVIILEGSKDKYSLDLHLESILYKELKPF